MRKTIASFRATIFLDIRQIKKHSIEVCYCPTSLMLADFFTKPLQGNLFRDMRDVAQGIAEYRLLMDKYSDSTVCETEYEKSEEAGNHVPILDVNDRKERAEIRKSTNIEECENESVKIKY